MSRHCIIGFISCLLLATAARAEPWSEKLGYGVGRKVVILQGRELGVTWETNDAGTNLLESGHVSSLSVLAAAPWTNQIAGWRAAHPDADVGLSIALTNPYKAISWRLLTSELGPTSLVDADGFPWKTVVQFAVSATADDVKAELDAQISHARKLGLKPTHLCGYYGTLFVRTDLATVILGAARKYWIPAPVVELTPELINRFRQDGFPVDQEMIELIKNYPLPKLDDLRASPNSRSFEDKRARFSQLLASLQPGLTQIVLRPAQDSPGLRALTPDWQQRVWDAQLLRDEQIQQQMKQEGIVLTNWREVMKRFETVPAPSGTDPNVVEVKE